MRIYKPYLLMALTLPFLSVSCQPQVESAKIVTIDKVGRHCHAGRNCPYWQNTVSDA